MGEDECVKADRETRSINESIAALDTLVTKFSNVRRDITTSHILLFSDRQSKVCNEEPDRKSLPDSVCAALDSLVSLFENEYKGIISANDLILECIRGPKTSIKSSD